MLQQDPAYKKLKEQSEQPQHNERNYRLIMENTTDMISRHDPDLTNDI